MSATHESAVIDGVLNSVSPSQINTYLDCPRAWWYTKVAKEGKAQGDWLDVGTAMHKQMEDWFEHGIEPEHPSCRAALALEQVPERGPGIYIEMPHDYTTGLFMSGVKVKGKVDLRCHRPGSDTFKVLDWKSCKNYSYAKAPDELARNPQGIIYLQYGFSVHPEATRGIFGHVYLKKEGHGAKPVLTDPLSREHVQEVYSELEVTVASMKRDAGAKDAEEVEYNTGACGKFGGCPFKPICPVWNTVKSPGGFDMEALLEAAPVKPALSLKDWLRSAPKKAIERFETRLINEIERGKRGLHVKVPALPTLAPGIITADTWTADPRAVVVPTERVLRPEDPHLPKPFPLATTLVTDSRINPPDAREPYPVTPWYPPEGT